jgi:hypothetical protein
MVFLETVIPCSDTGSHKCLQNKKGTTDLPAGRQVRRLKKSIQMGRRFSQIFMLKIKIAYAVYDKIMI